MSQRFDVVVVGGGSAGCVLAGRLSEDQRRSVLLLEAGPDGSNPALDGDSFLAALADPERTYASVQTERTRDAITTPYLLGRGVGGSSSVNAMIGTWGSPADYDHWERDLGCAGWSWRDVAPVFAGLAIPLDHAREDEWGDVDRALVLAARSLGHPSRADMLRQGEPGVGPASLTRANGRRVSAADAYLTPARGRSNLTVRADSHVARVLLDGADAHGVELVGGEVIEAGDVIVSAGAIHSPALLLASRVERVGIGVGLKDHPSASLTLRLIEPADVGRLSAATLLRWGSSTGQDDLQVLPMNHVGIPEYGALLVGLMTVHSAGTVRLREYEAVAQFDMLEDERDVVRLRAAARHVGALAGCDAFRSVADAVFIDDAGTPLEALDDDAVFDRWLRANVGGYAHASSSCRMGAVDDPTSVVDTSCRVHGYTNLHVCDASVFPDLPSANPYLPTVMVAERVAAAMIAS